MKKIIVFTIALLFSGTLFAQNNTAAKKSSSSLHKTAIGGMITDKYKRPYAGVQAFIYQKDSSIIASGFTDLTGYYETNSVLPGKYDLKIVYPNNKAILVKAVAIKQGVTLVNFNWGIPAGDTTVQYTDLLPKPAEKKKTAKTTGH